MSGGYEKAATQINVRHIFCPSPLREIRESFYLFPNLTMGYNHEETVKFSEGGSAMKRVMGSLFLNFRRWRLSPDSIL